MQKAELLTTLAYVLSNEPRFWFNALTNLYFTEYQMPWLSIHLYLKSLFASCARFGLNKYLGMIAAIILGLALIALRMQEPIY